MKVLLVYPAMPETVWSFKHALRFVAKLAAFPDIVIQSNSAVIAFSFPRAIA